MKDLILVLTFSMIYGVVLAQSVKIIKLNPPSSNRGSTVMKALQLRSSVTEWESTPISSQDLSDLLWAANGINRPEIGKRTAPSAMNAQDIDIYVVMKEGTYLYNAQEHELVLVTEGDFRDFIADRQEEVAIAPLICVLVSDISRFRSGDEKSKLEWAAFDAGTVSQNIAIFCSSVGLGTRPRATMNKEKLSELLNLKESQHLIINNPISHKKE